mmetsp:Transcript_58571/g.104156  ORF Transcript_58571/g.104156 Transcript_58571/m.104156 type:complete len:741 (-) Transcript_58571:88-2310(-)
MVPWTASAVLTYFDEPLFWMFIATTAFNPAMLLGTRYSRLLVPLALVAWLIFAAGISCFGSPSLLVEWCWRAMTARFSLFQVAVFGSAVVHMGLSFILNMHPILVQNTPHLQPYKIQAQKSPASLADWCHVIQHVLLSQLCVQLPLVTGLYFFITYFNTPYDYDSMPGRWDLARRVFLSLIVEDTWVYFGHRFLHDKRIYKYVHKVHHTYQSPFALDSEYEHPVETAVLGTGFFLACLLFTNHLAFMWVWLYGRLLVSYDSHSGYDLPNNLLHLIPWYNGAREHDWHHQFFDGNYAPTFVWWDRFFGTDVGFRKFEQRRRAKNVAKEAAEMEARGDKWYATSEGGAKGAPAGELDKQPESVKFSTCLVTGSEGMVGQRLVALLAERGARRIVCLDLTEKPGPAFDALKAKCDQDKHVELVYVCGDISSAKDMMDSGSSTSTSPFAGVEVVFHLAALVGPFFPKEKYDAVNHQGAKNVLEAFIRDGGGSGSKMVLVDCSTPSTRYPPTGEWKGLMEHEMTYQDTIHEYATTKALGEKVILAANGRKSSSGGHSLATCAVAPHQVYAPEDKLFLPAMIQTARSGKLRIFGHGEQAVSFTHAANVAHGLIVAASKLYIEGAASKAAGDFFVVTDGGAHNFWDRVNEAVVACGIPSLDNKMHLSPNLLKCVAYLGALYTKLTGRMVKLTPFTLRMLLINRTFSTAKARHVLGYKPIISFEDGWAETIAAAKCQFGTGLEKSHKS